MNDIDCIVSLTSWKGRIKNPEVPKVLYSIIRQKTKYRFKTVLVLSEQEFPGKESELPETIRMFAENGLIDILWTEDNLKAYKKLYPVMKTYPELPIMTTDDDIILAEDCVETYMNAHLRDPGVILTEQGSSMNDKGRTAGYSFRLFRLFPPHSLLDISSDYFKEYFKTSDDDAYVAVLAWAKKTRVKSLRSGKAKEIQSKEYRQTALRNEYRKNVNPVNCAMALMKALKDKRII